MLGWSNIWKSVIKALENSETQGIYLNIINTMYNKANSMFNEENIPNKTRISALHACIQYRANTLARPVTGNKQWYQGKGIGQSFLIRRYDSIHKRPYSHTSFLHLTKTRKGFSKAVGSKFDDTVSSFFRMPVDSRVRTLPKRSVGRGQRTMGQQCQNWV